MSLGHVVRAGTGERMPALLDDKSGVSENEIGRDSRWRDEVTTISSRR